MKSIIIPIFLLAFVLAFISVPAAHAASPVIVNHYGTTYTFAPDGTVYISYKGETTKLNFGFGAFGKLGTATVIKTVRGDQILINITSAKTLNLGFKKVSIGFTTTFLFYKYNPTVRVETK